MFVVFKIGVPDKIAGPLTLCSYTQTHEFVSPFTELHEYSQYVITDIQINTRSFLTTNYISHAVLKNSYSGYRVSGKSRRKMACMITREENGLYYQGGKWLTSPLREMVCITIEAQGP